MKKIKLESGRSMVEILGVLAVVGVLSVGGIWGYSYGMDKHKASETAKGLTMRAVDLLAQSEHGDTLTLDRWDDEPTPFPIYLEDNLMYIKHVPSRICKMIGDTLENTAAVYVEGIKYDPNSIADPCDTNDNHTIFFSFDPEVLADMGDIGHQPEEMPMTPTEILYASNVEDDEDEVSSTELIKTNEVYATDTGISIPEETGTPLIEVCPSAEPSREECDPDSDIYLPTITDKCLLYRIRDCYNREVRGDYSVKVCDYGNPWIDGWECRPEMSVIYSTDDEVVSTEIEEETTLFPVKPDESIDDEVVSTEIEEETTLFPVKPDIDCYHNGYLFEIQNNCKIVCPNRMTYNSGCVLPCPNGFYDAFSGVCHLCSETQDILEVNPSECAKCPNRESVPYGASDICRLKENDEVVSTEIEEETTLFPVKPDETISSVESEETTVVVISEPIDLIARLKRENSSCPDPYYDSVTQTVYYYAEWDPWDKCSVRTCIWETYINDWMCQG